MRKTYVLRGPNDSHKATCSEKLAGRGLRKVACAEGLAKTQGRLAQNNLHEVTCSKELGQTDMLVE